MGQKIKQWVVESLLTEQTNKTVVTYVGRFHPFHSGHNAVYQHLVKKFGKQNVHIGTSNKVQLPKSPFNFKEKVQIMTKMFGIPKSNIHQVKNPYRPDEILKKFDDKKTAFVTVVGEKDKGRLGMGKGRYFQPYKGNTDLPMKDNGYVYIVPPQGRGISGTEVRQGIGRGEESQKKAFFKKVYGKFDPKIFNLLTKKITKTESVMESFFESINFKSLIEGSLYGADAGEPDTIYVPAGKKRVLGTQKSSQKDEPWMDSMGYTQMHFPTADSIYSKDSKGTSDEAEYYAIKKIKKNPALKEPVPSDDFVTSGIGEKGEELHKIDEASVLNLGKGVVDDGPGAFYGDMKTFKSEMEEVIGKLGWNIVTYLMDEDDMESFTDTEYPNGPGRYPVSFFPQGKAGLDALAVRYGDDLQGLPAYRKWANHIKGVALQLGYEFLNFLEPKDQDNVLSDEPKKEEDTTGTLKESIERYDLINEAKQLLKIPSDIQKIHKAFKKNGKKLYVVGGAVRDAILGKSPKDYDLATDAKPDEVLKIAKDTGMKTVEVGKSFGVVMVGGHEIATFRKDIGKGRRPSSVDYTDIEGDVRRRDLTINALFYDIDKKEIVDLVGGIADLKKKNIRTVGKASERFDEDPLRKLRALRFQASTGGKLDKELHDALQSDPSLKGVSAERIRDEFVKSIKKAKNPSKYLEMCDKLGFTQQILPNLKVSKPYPNDNDYILFLSSILSKNSPVVLSKVLNKLTYSNEEKNNIVFLVSLQSFRPDDIVVYKNAQNKTSLSDDQIKKFGKSIGKDMDKFVKFNLSVGGRDVPKDIKGPQIGLWIKNKEKENFLDEKKKPKKKVKSKKASLMKQKRKFYLKPDNAKKELDSSGREGQVLSKKVGKQRLYFVSYVGNVGTQNIFDEGMIMEGGAYGHMNHPFDTEMNLTFGDLKTIISNALNGKLEFTREKTDGQALAISYRKDRGIIAARNQGHLKNRGLNALDIKGVSDKFANRGGLTDAYNFAMRDLESAISKLSDAQRQKIFKDGSKFMNLEVIWPESVNVIPYGQPLLVFHGTMEYGEDGKAIGADTSDAKVLAGMIKQVNADVQSQYTIKGPPVINLPKTKELSKMQSKFFSQVSKLQKEFKLKDSNGVADYHQAWWSNFVDKNSPSTLDNKTKMGLVKRWAFYDKKFRLDKKNISDSKTLDWAKKTDKQDHAKMAKQNIRPFEDIFLGVGAEVLSFMSSALTVNPDKALRDIQKQLDKTIKDVNKSGDEKKIAKLKMELERLNSIGGRNKIVPNEGIVFTYKGNTYKLTGTFAPLNQILGLFY
jgi:tRNA nucleotidyltransferase/poly(A) polymerase